MGSKGMEGGSGKLGGQSKLHDMIKRTERWCTKKTSNANTNENIRTCPLLMKQISQRKER